MLIFRNKSVTLIELIIAISLLAVIILGINGINIFSNYHVISADRRAKLQNDVSRCLEHITKYASQAIGNEVVLATSGGSVVRIDANANTLDIFTDANGNGISDVAGSTPKDKWIRYQLDSANHQLKYYADCGNAATPSSSCVGTPEILANNITTFSVSKNFSQNGNYVNVEDITACWNPTTMSTCNTPDNPQVTMKTSISLPAVSTN